MPSPVDLFELPFLREALIEVVLLALAGGMVGAWIVLRRLAFFSHAVGSATFPGLVTADATGVSASLLALAVALGYAGGVGGARRAGRESEAATALLLVAALGLGVVLASDVFESGASVDRLLFGTLLGLDGSDLVLSGVCALVALAASLTLGRAWTAIGFDPESAPALGPAGHARRPRAARTGGARRRGRDPRRGRAARGGRVRAARRGGAPDRAQRARAARVGGGAGPGGGERGPLPRLLARRSARARRSPCWARPCTACWRSPPSLNARRPAAVTP